MDRVALIIAATAVGVIGTEVAAQQSWPTLAAFIHDLSAKALPYQDSGRKDRYLMVSAMADALRRGGDEIRIVAEAEAETFSPDFPILTILDEDGDTVGDFFLYLSVEHPEAQTLEYGAFFGAIKGSRPTWIVFNGGPVVEDLHAEEMRIYWATHQYVDRDADGRMDIVIVNGVDPEGDWLTKAEDSAWYFDDDADGLVDRAELLIDGTFRPFLAQNGTFSRVSIILDEVSDSDPGLFRLGNFMADDIQRVLSQAHQ